MELKAYWRILAEGKRLILFTTLIFVVIAAGVGIFGYSGFKGSFNLYFIPQMQSVEGQESDAPKVIEETIDEFSVDLDQFYRLRAADLNARMARQLLYDPAVQNDIFKHPVFASSTPSYKVDQLGSQLLRVKFAISKNDEAIPFMDAVAQELNTRLGVMQGRHDQFASFRVQGFDLDLAPHSPNTKANAALAIMLGLIFGSFLVLFRHYWRTDDN